MTVRYAFKNSNPVEVNSFVPYFHRLLWRRYCEFSDYNPIGFKIRLTVSSSGDTCEKSSQEANRRREEHSNPLEKHASHHGDLLVHNPGGRNYISGRTGVNQLLSLDDVSLCGVVKQLVALIFACLRSWKCPTFYGLLIAVFLAFDDAVRRERECRKEVYVCAREWKRYTEKEVHTNRAVQCHMYRFQKKCSQPHLHVYTEMFTASFTDLHRDADLPWNRDYSRRARERKGWVSRNGWIVFYDNPALHGRHQKEAENMQKNHIKFSLHWWQLLMWADR